jgi:hypothetical protein
MPKFRKKPVEVEARQFTGSKDSAEALAAWMTENGGTFHATGTIYRRMVVSTLESGRTADPGDWIVQGPRGEFYPVKADLFSADYEQV